MKKLIALPILIFVMISIAYASELQVSDFRIHINGEDEGSIRNNSVYSDIIEPGDEVELEIELENKFKNDTDINDITISGVIENIVENVNLTDSVAEFDLSNGNKKIKKLHFDIPNDADELQKKVSITIKGIDDKKKKHLITLAVYLNIDDEEHEIKVYKTKSDQIISACNETGNIIVLLSNDGSYDEDDVTLKAVSKELGMEKVYSGISIDEDGTYTKIVPIFVEDHNKIGVYTIDIKAYYKEDHLDDVKTLNINIEACKSGNYTHNNAISDEEQAEDEEVVVISKNDSIIETEKNQDNNIGISDTANKTGDEDDKTKVIFIFSIILFILVLIVITAVFIIKK